MAGNDRRYVNYTLPSADTIIHAYDRRHVTWTYPFSDHNTGPSGSVYIPPRTQPTDEFSYVTGTLAIDRSIKLPCWSNLVRPWEFIKKLQSVLKVEFLFSRGSELINHGFPTPNINPFRMWGRLDGNLNPLGWYAYIKGSWRNFYTDMTGQGSVRWITGDSNSPPDGWQPIRTGTTGIDSTIVASMVDQYVEISPGRYSYYAARFIGHE